MMPVSGCDRPDSFLFTPVTIAAMILCMQVLWTPTHDDSDATSTSTGPTVCSRVTAECEGNSEQRDFGCSSQGSLMQTCRVTTPSCERGSCYCVRVYRLMQRAARQAEELNAAMSAREAIMNAPDAGPGS